MKRVSSLYWEVLDQFKKSFTLQGNSVTLMLLLSECTYMQGAFEFNEVFTLNEQLRRLGIRLGGLESYK